MEIKLNMFQLKLIAAISMVIDHTAVMLGTDFMYYMPMRTIGRISYPIFAFLVANGWNKTHDKTAYISRMMIFAAVSEIPHLLLFGFEKNTGLFNHVVFFTLLYLLVFICLLLYFAVNEKQNKIIYIIFSAFYFFMPFFTGRRNVLYTFTYSMFVMAFIDNIKKVPYINIEKGKIPILSVINKKNIILIPLMIAPTLISGEYGFMGALLIVLLSKSINKNNAFSAFFIVLWALNEYIINLSSITFFIPVLLSAMLCLLYNGKKGSDKKYVFYVFYPLHLFILGIMRIFCF
ncbi:MAG: conjugal transfer protein TraX [Clostridia bacterium]|jgi:hypothetical protein|nr:conjugal transfer protein TraX [Clostridia bacterium]